jgi:hypothetical protein
MEHLGRIEIAVALWLRAQGWTVEVKAGDLMAHRGETNLDATSLALAIAEALDGKR